MKIGLLCNKNDNESTYRINFLGLLKASSKLDFSCEYVENLTTYPDVIFTQRHIDSQNPQINSFLKECKENGVKIAVFINDIYQEDFPRLNSWSQLADLILTPTELHKQFIQSLIDVPVEVMIDAIDYNLDEYFPLNQSNNIPKICWFGYPESYWKSMNLYQDIIEEYVNKGLMEFKLITSPNINCNFPVIPFDNSTFIDTLRQFDGCILSHAPLDYNINTFVKSPNKLTLSITLGVPCITSNTPSYSDILDNTQLSQFKFSGRESFRRSLDNLLSLENRKHYLSSSQQYVLDNYSYVKMAKQLLNHISCLPK